MTTIVIIEINITSLKNSTFLAEARAILGDMKFKELRFDTSMGVFMSGQSTTTATVVNKLKKCPSYDKEKNGIKIHAGSVSTQAK